MRLMERAETGDMLMVFGEKFRVAKTHDKGVLGATLQQNFFLNSKENTRLGAKRNSRPIYPPGDVILTLSEYLSIL